ncbi:MAG: cytochrome c [Deltaproteobacteria bacterium]|uniref:cytochrome c n=1 Tax=Candidatus Deferrimicrobium sp. TaxID=3060586 RepID=UPI002722F381|nr:cytochrome c [Candidatus Deferrimicrobium sp.]MCR4308894.1 cytochrome c [Deltaproteobacteria bacterium]MDO8739682.1 cytochrome c [Candidatus Deferrimicrobium sp.]
MKAQHERMGNFKAAMVALGEAVIHGNKTDAGKHASRLSEALRGYEKDIPHKNVSRIKEFQALYGETKKRVTRLAADADTGNLQKVALSYGRVLEACVSCHKQYRD